MFVFAGVGPERLGDDEKDFGVEILFFLEDFNYFSESVGEEGLLADRISLSALSLELLLPIAYHYFIYYPYYN